MAQKAFVRDKICIKLYTEEDHSNITKEPLKPGDIIIATNISGRGTDYKTTMEL
jgi:preprotein translocase subunit SecA